MLTTFGKEGKIVIIELKGKMIFICKNKKKKKISKKNFKKGGFVFIDVLEK